MVYINNLIEATPAVGTRMLTVRKTEQKISKEIMWVEIKRYSSNEISEL